MSRGKPAIKKSQGRDLNGRKVRVSVREARATPSAYRVSYESLGPLDRQPWRVAEVDGRDYPEPDEDAPIFGTIGEAEDEADGRNAYC